MLTPPEGLPADELTATLVRGWRLVPASMVYRPVGFGSHHWEVTDAADARWFVTADELAAKQRRAGEPLDSAYGRLRAALAAALALREGGHEYVVAPVRAANGEPLARAGAGFAVAVYPFVEGQSFAWGEFGSPGHRQAMLDLITAVHAAPDPVRRQAGVDDYSLDHRDALEAALAGDDRGVDGGPYARPAVDLLGRHAAPLRRLLARYDELVGAARADPGRAVLTHGEPHPGNTMLSAAGWRLIDWDTALVAPPERDLWSLDPGDGSVLRGYAEATGVAPLPALLELYRIRWDLTDIGVETGRFRRPHTGGSDDEAGWEVLHSTVTRLAG